MGIKTIEFSRRIYTKIEFSSQRREMLLFLTTVNLADAGKPDRMELLFTHGKDDIQCDFCNAAKLCPAGH